MVVTFHGSVQAAQIDCKSVGLLGVPRLHLATRHGNVQAVQTHCH